MDTDQRAVAVSLDDLAADPRNPRKIGEKSAAGLGKSMGEFGDLSVIVYNQRTRELVAGHQRVDQLRAAGAAEVVMEAGDPPGTDAGRGYIIHPRTGERFVVRFVDWDRKRQTAANLAANNPAIQGTFTEGLGTLLDEVKIGLGDADFAGLGFVDLVDMDQRGVLDLWPAPAHESATAVQEDAVPEPVGTDEEADSKPGQLYELGLCIRCEHCGELIDL